MNRLFGRQIPLNVHLFLAVRKQKEVFGCQVSAVRRITHIVSVQIARCVKARIVRLLFLAFFICISEQCWQTGDDLTFRIDVSVMEI